MSRLQINIIFACIVAALGLTAATAVYRNSRSSRTEAGGSRLPENHPPIDASERIAALRQMVERDPGNPEYLTQLGNLYYDLGQHASAIEFYQRSLSLRPQDPAVETDLATCFHYIGEHDKSLQLLDRVLAYSPGHAQAMFNKGIVLIEGKQDKRGGIAVWEELLRSNPSFQHRAELERRIDSLRASLK